MGKIIQSVRRFLRGPYPFFCRVNRPLSSFVPFLPLENLKRLMNFTILIYFTIFYTSFGTQDECLVKMEELETSMTDGAEDAVPRKKSQRNAKKDMKLDFLGENLVFARYYPKRI